jgi:hypothetical protein
MVNNFPNSRSRQLFCPETVSSTRRLFCVNLHTKNAPKILSDLNFFDWHIQKFHDADYRHLVGWLKPLNKRIGPQFYSAVPRKEVYVFNQTHIVLIKPLF